MKKLILSLGLAIIATGAFVGAPSGRVEHPKSAVTAVESLNLAPSQDPPGTIDGAVTPELIPDEVAYSLFFNFVAGRVTEKEKNSLKPYMQQVQLGNINLEALISTSREYQQGVNSIDSQQAALARANHQNLPNIETQLNELTQRKQALVNEKIQSLPERLGKAGATSVRRHVMEHIKRKVKIIPGPVMPPTAH